MSDRAERIILEVDERGAITAVGSANQALGRLEASAYRAGHTLEQKLLVKYAGLRREAAGNVEMLKEIDASQERALGRLHENLAKGGAAAQTMGASFRSAVGELGGMILGFTALEQVVKRTAVETALHASRTETMGVALRAAAQANGENLGLLRQQEEGLKRQGIATQEARQALLRMVTAQMDVSKATRLGRLAQDAAVVGSPTHRKPSSR